MTDESPSPGPRGPRPPAPAPGPRFVMAGGGTGGHVIPALAVARELRKRGHDVFFVGTERGIEGKLVPAEGFELKKIEIGGLNRVRLQPEDQRRCCACRSRPWGAGIACAGAAAVFSMGGYVAGPPVIAALLGADSRRRHGAECRPRIHQPRDRTLGVARADLVSGDGALLSARAGPRSPDCRCARSSSRSRPSRAATC